MQGVFLVSRLSLAIHCNWSCMGYLGLHLSEENIKEGESGLGQTLPHQNAIYSEKVRSCSSQMDWE